MKNLKKYLTYVASVSAFALIAACSSGTDGNLIGKVGNATITTDTGTLTVKAGESGKVVVHIAYTGDDKKDEVTLTPSAVDSEAKSVTGITFEPTTVSLSDSHKSKDLTVKVDGAVSPADYRIKFKSGDTTLTDGDVVVSVTAK